jgi:hypothetical protein
MATVPSPPPRLLAPKPEPVALVHSRSHAAVSNSRKGLPRPSREAPQNPADEAIVVQKEERMEDILNMIATIIMMMFGFMLGYIIGYPISRLFWRWYFNRKS